MYEQTNEKRIAQLQPTVARLAREWLRKVTAEGIAVCVVQGLRTTAEQDALYAQGRTQPGQVVTNARGGHSYHNYGLAFDYCLVKVDGSLDWNVTPAWRLAAEIGKSLGFEWGGDWTGTLIDYPHLQYTFGLTITQLLAGKRPPADNGGIAVMEVVKERIFAKDGKLVRCDGDYKQPASDVRYIKFPAGRVRFKFVARKGAKVSALLDEFGADFATNAPYFWDGLVLGDARADGQVISQAYGKMLKWHEFAAKDGRPQIGHLDPSVKWDVLVQGAPLLIEEGNLVWEYYRVQQEVPDDIGKKISQRTLYGIDAAGDLHIAVADGRTKYDKGLSLEESALFMKSKGCTWAINFDGGDSSVIAQKGQGSLGQNQGAAEHTVNHALLIWIVEQAPVIQPEQPDWKQQGVDWLLQIGGIESIHTPGENVDFGTLGTVIKNLKTKGVL